MYHVAGAVVVHTVAGEVVAIKLWQIGQYGAADFLPVCHYGLKLYVVWQAYFKASSEGLAAIWGGRRYI